MTTRSRQPTQTPVPRYRQSTGTPATRGRLSTATPAPSRATGNQLPPYEPPVFSLNPDAQRALAVLTQSHGLKKLEKHSGEAQSSVSNSAAEINDRLHAREKAVEKRRRDQEQAGSEEPGNSQSDDYEQSLEEMRDKVDRMTQRMDEGMRKIIDGQHNLQYIKESVAKTADDARANASTQASTQQTRSQRRPRRGSGSEEEEEEEEEYPDFTPTDPTGGTQAPQSAIEAFRSKLENAETRYQSHSLADRYAENPDYVGFRQLVHDARNPDGDVRIPHASEWFPEGDIPAPGITARARANVQDEDNEEDDDIAIARATISTKCPLTLAEFKNPVSSKKCQHSFESDAIMEMIRNSATRGSVQCPVPGCKEVLGKSDLHVDQVLLRQIKRLQHAKELEEEDAEDDGSDGRTQRNATLIDDDEDGAEIDTLIERQTRMKNEPRATGAFAAPAATAPPSTAPIELGGSSDEEADEDTEME